MQLCNRLGLLRELLVLGSLGLTALTLSSAQAQEKSDPARGDFGSVPQVGQTNAGVVSGANIYGPPSTPSSPIRPSSWPSGSSSAKSSGTASPRSSLLGGTSISQIPYTDTREGAEQTSASTGTGSGGNGTAVDGELSPCEGTQIIARVGSEVILACEVMAPVNGYILSHKDEIPPQQIEEVRKRRTQEQLQQIVSVKLLYLDAKSEIARESFQGIENKLYDYFERVEIDRMIKQAKVNTRDELETKLRTVGSSMNRERRAFMERTLAQEWVRQKVKFDGEIQVFEIVDYYREHPDEFDQPAQARWEELMVRFNKYPNKAAALDAITQMGNQVFQGKPIPEVAKEKSDGPTASSGGRRDWTTKGSLVAAELDRALFGLPVGQLSQIIETNWGYHIIRVVERKEATRTPFVEAQVKIRDTIRDKKSQEQHLAFVEKLKGRTPITTIFDEAQQAGRPASPVR